MSGVKVVHLISSLERGGRERQLATIFKYSDNNRVNAKIVCLKQSDNSYIKEYHLEGDVSFLKSQSNLGRFKELRKIIFAEGTSILWTWGVMESTLGIIVTVFSKVKHINGSVRHGIVLYNFRQLWRLLLLHLSRNIVANSRTGLKANRLKRGYVMYNGLDKLFLSDHSASSNEIRTQLGIRKNIICLVSVANLVPYKDYETVLRALLNMKQNGNFFHYIIIGEGPERQKVELLIAKLDLIDYVTLVGRQSDVKSYLLAADIFVHSSKGEGCSNAILEAMAIGLPVIASSTGGTVEIVDDTVGRLFEYKNINQLTRHFNELFSSADLRNSLGRKSRTRIATLFSIEKMMQEYYSILERVENK